MPTIASAPDYDTFDRPPLDQPAATVPLLQVGETRVAAGADADSPVSYDSHVVAMRRADYVDPSVAARADAHNNVPLCLSQPAQHGSLLAGQSGHQGSLPPPTEFVLPGVGHDADEDNDAAVAIGSGAFRGWYAKWQMFQPFPKQPRMGRGAKNGKVTKRGEGTWRSLKPVRDEILGEEGGMFSREPNYKTVRIVREGPAFFSVPAYPRFCYRALNIGGERLTLRSVWDLMVQIIVLIVFVGSLTYITNLFTENLLCPKK